MTDANSYPLPIEGLQPVAGMPGHRWAVPSLSVLQHLLAHAAAHPEEARTRGRRGFLETQGSDIRAAWLSLPFRPFQTLPALQRHTDSHLTTRTCSHTPSCLHELLWGHACDVSISQARASSLTSLLWPRVPHVPASDCRTAREDMVRLYAPPEVARQVVARLRHIQSFVEARVAAVSVLDTVS